MTGFMDRNRIRPGDRGRAVTGLVLGALALLVAAARLRTFGEPPCRDINTYSVMASAWLDGRPLYSDLWDLKPPVIYWLYAFAQMIAGRGYLSIYLLTVAGSLATMLGVYLATAINRRLRVAGLVAAATFALAGGDVHLQGNEPNAEVFMNAALVMAFAFLIRLRPRSGDVTGAIIVGLLLALASLFKTVAVAQAFGFGGAFVLAHLQTRSERFAAFRLMLMAAAAAAMAWIAVFAGYYVHGTLRDFWRTVFVYNTYYSSLGGSGIVSNILEGLRPSLLLPRAMRVLLPAAILAGAGLVCVRRRRVSVPVVCLGGYLAATLVAVAMPGQFAAHYYQLWSPPLCIGAGWGAMALSRRLGRAARNPRFAHAPVVALLLCTAAIALPPYAFNAAEWSRMKYGADPAVEIQTGHAIRKLLKPGETFYQWGTTIGLHFAAQTPLPSGVFFVQPLLGGPQQEECTQRLIGNLEQTRPELVVMDGRDMPPMTRHPVVQWFARNYDEMGRDPVTGRFRLLCRKGGRLARERRP